ncbi:MAG TPA: PAS domain S-box protein [Thermoanaerobaculia bacterium]|nr:PAS domain S-box protein [Thermoanaerobaculia bacterium]
MLPPPPLPAERSRLDALARYAILDTNPEEAFDEIAGLASTVCAAPIALISLVDDTRQWFKARKGLDPCETPRELSFCAHAIAGDDLFIVPDARADPRFHDNPLVLGAPGIRFYAGAQLTTPDGHNLGALCVIDREPRVLTGVQCNALRALARQVIVQLELRRQIAVRSKAERELDQFFDLSLELLCIAGFDGYFRRLNPAFETVLGYRIDELLELPFLDLVHADDRETTVAELARLRSGVKTAYFENRYRCRDGTSKWISWTAAPLAEEGLIYATGRDITSLKVSDEELRRSEARTRSIIDHALGGLITSDGRGIIQSVNPAAQQMFGYAAPQLIGRSVRMLLAADYESDEACLRDIRERALGRVTEWRGLRANGEVFACELSLFEFSLFDRSSSDPHRHFAAHMLDVSQRQEVERMKQDFVSTVSHELRTPLTSIRGSLGLLASGVMGELSDDARQMVAVAERNSVRLIALINDILDFEKLENGKMEMDIRPMPLMRMLERSIETISASAMQDGVDIELRCPRAIVLGDETRLGQVTTNLLSNAVKYSKRGDTIVVSAQLRDGSVEVRVEDRGRGIPPALQHRLFQRFVQIDSSDARTKPGTGLGLAICRAIIEQHGGEIGVESREGEGSTFWFRVRSAGEATEPGLQTKLDVEVLIIEDDVELLDILARQLAADGLRVRTARSGWAALAAVGERVPALLVLDVDLPDIDGFGVVAELRNQPAHRNVPLLVYTGMDLTTAQRNRLQLGPTRFLMKSRSSGDEFRSVVGRLLDYARARELAG